MEQEPQYKVKQRAIMTSETYCLCFTLCPSVIVAEINMAMLAGVPELLFFVFIS